MDLAGLFKDPPPGVNPFDVAATQMRYAVFFEHREPWFVANLIAFYVILSLSITLHILGIIIPFCGGKTARGRHLWIVRTMYSGQHNIPYLIPNGRLFSALFSGVSAALYLVLFGYLIWAPRSLNAALFELPVMMLWWQYWLTSFDALFAIWISGTRNNQKKAGFVRNPWFLNTACWLVPIVMTAMISVMLARLFYVYSHLQDNVHRFLDILAVGSTQYNDGGMAAVKVMPDIETLGAQIMTQFVTFGGQVGLILRSEAAWFAVAMALFTVSLIVLVKTVYTRLSPKKAAMPVYAMNNRKNNGGQPTDTAIAGIGSTNASIARLTQGGQPQQTAALRKQYRLLICFFAFLAVLVLWQGSELLYIQGHPTDLQLNERPYQVWLITAFWPEATFLFFISVLSFYRVVEGPSRWGQGRTPSHESKDSRSNLKTRAIGLFGRAWQSPQEEEQQQLEEFHQRTMDPTGSTLTFGDGYGRGVGTPVQDPRDQAIFVSVVTRRSFDEEKRSDVKVPV